VVSIRHGCPIDKAAFFNTLLASNDTAAGRVDNDEWANDGEDPEASVDWKAEDFQAQGQEEKQDEKQGEEEVIVEEDHPNTATVEQVWELAMPQQGRMHDLSKLPQAEQEMQRQLGGRQTLCIADPVEKCRTLGTTFQGMERLVRELRRACELTGIGCGMAHITELFSDKAVPSKRRHWSIFEQQRSRSKIRIPQADVGCVMGRGGARIRELRSIEGMSSIRITDAPAGESHAIVHIVGSESAVDECCRRIEIMLEKQPASQGSTARTSGKQPASSQQTANATTSKSRWQPVGVSTSAYTAVAEEGFAASESSTCSTPVMRGSRWGERQGPTNRAPRGGGRSQRRW